MQTQNDIRSSIRMPRPKHVDEHRQPVSGNQPNLDARVGDAAGIQVEVVGGTFKQIKRNGANISGG